MTRTILLPVFVSGLLSMSLAGQNIPKRLPLNGADTNQAAAYYQYGLSMLQQDPPKASGAFYWAIFYVMGNGDSARAEMEQAIAKLREKDAKDFVWLYESKAVLEHFIGLTYERQNQIGPAREAYGRALQEDLSYFPAHMRLGSVALSAGDTATALSEMDLAAQIRDDDPGLQATYGTVLAQTGHIPEAEQHLHRAVELDPYFANSYYVLGRVDEFAGKAADAVGDYRAYLGHTRAEDPRIADVQRRLAGLGTAAGPNR